MTNESVYLLPASYFAKDHPPPCLRYNNVGGPCVNGAMPLAYDNTIAFTASLSPFTVSSFSRRVKHWVLLRRPLI